jgi:hypothetical protein
MGAGTGEVRVSFGGDERLFRIRWGEIRRIEDKCATGIGEVLRRLSRAVMVLSQLRGMEALAAGLDIHAQDIREVIYQGLRGGGMPESQVALLLRIEIDERGIAGLMDNVSVALGVLWGAQSAPEADDVGERRAGATSTTPASEQTSASSSASAKPSASPPETSKTSPPGSSTPPSRAGKKPTSPTPASDPQPPQSTTT